MVDTKNPPARATGRTKNKRGSAVSRAGRNIIASLMRRADIQSVKVQGATVADLSIDEVVIGASSVETLTIADINTLVSTGRVSLDDVTTTVRLVIHVDWRVNLLFSTPSDSFRLGSFAFDFDVGNIDIPELEDLAITIPAATASETVATVQSIVDLKFNGGQIDDIAIMDIRLPAQGYGLDGISFDTFNLSHIGVSETSVGKINIGSLSPNGQLTIPSAEIRDIGIADVQVPTVNSTQAINVSDIQASSRRITLVDIGLLRVRIVVEPTLEMTIGGLTMDEIEASSTISSVKLENMRFPLSVKGIELSDISASGLRADQISL